eukprot:TRINITY_DN2057_c0_g2_i1.p1 TRINITY_DN2057_c0_g2~~TRINITY_DN2057_c0_g2_i1.p1  ORF type:complete len:348 (-),score=113.44 TRINITY_DN2057_c0_g2_i1:133-1176(-)
MFIKIYYIILSIIAVFWNIFLSIPFIGPFIDDLLYGVSQKFKIDESNLPKDDGDFEHSYVEINKLALHCVTIGDKSNPLMVFVHGFPENWYSYRHQMIEFSSDYYCVAFDMRGYGLSEKPRHRRDYQMDNLVEDLHQIILHFSGDDNKCDVLVSHDWGGAIAWTYEYEYPETINNCVTLNIPHPVLFAKALQSDPVQMKKSWYIFFFQLPFLPEMVLLKGKGKGIQDIFKNTFVHPENISDEELKRLSEPMLTPGAATACIAYYRNLFHPSGAGKVKKLSKMVLEGPRVLYVHGEKDFALGKELTVDTGKYVKDLRLEYIPDSSHWVQQDTPDKINALMRDFLEFED